MNRKGTIWEGVVLNRRELLTSAAVSLVPREASSRAPEGGVERLALELAEEMQRVHGGMWATHIDHENGYLFIRQKFLD